MGVSQNDEYIASDAMVIDGDSKASDLDGSDRKRSKKTKLIPLAQQPRNANGTFAACRADMEDEARDDSPDLS